MEAISLVISGPIKSRINRGIDLQNTAICLRNFLSLNHNNEIIISTYQDELEPLLTNIATKIVINDDPGPDEYRILPWPMHSSKKSQTSNISRMLITTCAGLEATKNKFVIRTRIELLPSDILKFSKILDNLIIEFHARGELKIAFLLEHYSGLKYSVDGTLGGIPDTFQIGRRETLKNIWQSSKCIWKKNYSILTHKRVVFPISSEQLLGYNFFYLYANFKLNDKISRVRKGYVSVQLLKSIRYSEQNYFKFLKYDDIGLSKNYFKGSVNIRFKTFNCSIDVFNKIGEIAWVILKKTKHFFRRFSRGTKITFLNWIRNSH